MIRRLIILLLIVGCEETGITSNGLTDGTAVTDTLYYYDTLLVNIDTTIIIFDTTITFNYDTTIINEYDTTITIEYDTTITFLYDTTITVYDTTIIITDTLIIYEDSDCLGIVGGGAFIDDCGQCIEWNNRTIRKTTYKMIVDCVVAIMKIKMIVEYVEVQVHPQTMIVMGCVQLV